MRACAAPGPAARRAALAGPERWRCRQCGSGLRTRDVNDREVSLHRLWRTGAVGGQRRGRGDGREDRRGHPGRGGGAGSANGVVTLGEVVKERQKRLLMAIELERAAQKEQMIARYSSRSLAALEREGIVVTNLACERQGEMFSDVVFRLTPAGGGTMRRHRFSVRDNVRVSRVDKTNNANTKPASGRPAEQPARRSGSRAGASGRPARGDAPASAAPDEAEVEANGALWVGDGESGEEEAPAPVKSFEGVVVEVTREHVSVALREEQGAELSRMLRQDPECHVGWRMDEDVEDKMYDQLRRAIQGLGEWSESIPPDSEVNVRRVLVTVPGIDLTRLSKMLPPWVEEQAWLQAAGQALRSLPGLNDSQRRAIGAALTRSVVLWQGPPGTGKTTTLTGLLTVMVAANAALGARPGVPARRGSASAQYLRGATAIKPALMGPILACAGTNAATDNIVEGLLKRGVDVVRLGNPARVREELRDQTLEARARSSPRGQAAAAREREAMGRVEMTEEKMARLEGMIKEWGPGRASEEAWEERERLRRELRAAVRMREEARDELKLVGKELLRRCQVIVATCAAAGDPVISEMGLKFTAVVVDEAAQVPEAHCLIPLTRGAQMVVLAGDPRQLPPTVLSKEAADAGLSDTLFQRLMTAGLEPALLDVQYRMHPAIALLPSRLFYQGRVRSGIESHERPLLPGLPWPSPEVPVAMWDVGPGFESRDENKSWKNATEAALVDALLRTAIRSRAFVNERPTVALLTPYRGQARLLASRVADVVDGRTPLLGECVTVSTVDGYQGREADLVIISTVKSNRHGSLGFVADPRRMNVALTRARRGVMVVGSAATLSNDPKWARWLEWCREQGVMRAGADVEAGGVDSAGGGLRGSGGGGVEGGSGGGVEGGSGRGSGGGSAAGGSRSGKARSRVSRDDVTDGMGSGGGDGSNGGTTSGVSRGGGSRASSKGSKGSGVSKGSGSGAASSEGGSGGPGSSSGAKKRASPAPASLRPLPGTGRGGPDTGS